MEKNILFIAAIVFIVGFVGFITVMPQTEESTSDSLTGNLAREIKPIDACGSCEGTPVCAAKDAKAYNYPSACAARCDDAHILYDDVCEQIPRGSGQ